MTWSSSSASSPSVKNVPMAGTAAPKAGGRLSRPGWRKWLLLTSLVVISGVGLALWSTGLPLSWTADYDRDRYERIRRAIEADPRHLLGRPFDEVSKKLGLADVPWDDGAFQQVGPFRIYHFRGFALYVTLDVPSPGSTPYLNSQWAVTQEQIDRHGVLWLLHQEPFVRIDGVRDGKERMARYWKAIEEECERINAEMDRKRREADAMKDE